MDCRAAYLVMGKEPLWDTQLFDLNRGICLINKTESELMKVTWSVKAQYISFEMLNQLF